MRTNRKHHSKKLVRQTWKNNNLRVDCKIRFKNDMYLRIELMMNVVRCQLTQNTISVRGKLVSNQLNEMNTEPAKSKS